MVPDGGEQNEDGRDRPNPPDRVVPPDAALLRVDPSVLGSGRFFSALSHPRRRYLIYALAADAELTLTELATKLAAWEAGADEREVDDRARDRLYASLYHVHIPKLVDQGVVEYDADAEIIARADHAEQAFAVLAGAGGSLDLLQKRHACRASDRKSDPKSP